MLQPNDQIGPYTLIRQLGRGAFGIVWLAEKRTAITTTRVALKLSLDEDPDLSAIKQEANLWVDASGHPNVLPIIDADLFEGQVVIVSEYAPDGSLEGWIKSHGGRAPSVAAAASMVRGILAGLEHLHSKKIIHRDLKPANILLQGETPRLADFGLARVLKTSANTANIAGSPAYMSPEAFDGKRSVQSDIWSVAVIFYQLLCGRMPFPQTEIIALIGAIGLRDPEAFPDSVPKQYQEVIKRALQKDPAARYSSAKAMLLDLQIVADQEEKQRADKEHKEKKETKDIEQEKETVKDPIDKKTVKDEAEKKINKDEAGKKTPPTAPPKTMSQLDRYLEAPLFIISFYAIVIVAAVYGGIHGANPEEVRQLYHSNTPASGPIMLVITIISRIIASIFKLTIMTEANSEIAGSVVIQALLYGVICFILIALLIGILGAIAENMKNKKS